MELPPAEELSRWTVNQVTNWLLQSSLTAFRESFLVDGVDGSKLMNLSPEDVDAKYKHIGKKKREVLKEHLRNIKNFRSPPKWNAAAPQLPPRSGGPRVPPFPPATDDDESDGEAGWDTDFEEDSDPEEYLEPTTNPKQPPPRPGPNVNGGHHRPPPPPPSAAPEPEYEITDQEEVKPSSGLIRKPSIVDRLKNELASRNSTEEPTPPPRPPRGNAGKSSSPTPSRVQKPRQPPQPPPPTETRENDAAPEDVYEIMSDTPDNGSVHRPHGREPPKPEPEPEPLPPRPGKKLSTERPPPQPPTEQGGFLFNNAQAAGDDLSRYPWYHGKISRDSATKIFEREQKDGMFLIRKSERDPNQPYTLVIWQSNRIWNIPIRKLSNNMYAAGKFKQGETQFKSIVDLVEHFKVVSLSLKSAADQAEGTNKLTIPAPKR